MARLIGDDVGSMNTRVFLCLTGTWVQMEQFIWMETGTLGPPMNVWMNTQSQPTLVWHLASQRGVHFSNSQKPHVREIQILISVHLMTHINHQVVLSALNKHDVLLVTCFQFLFKK